MNTGLGLEIGMAKGDLNQGLGEGKAGSSCETRFYDRAVGK